NVSLVLKTDTVEVKKLVHDGQYKAAIVIPPNASETLRKKTQQTIGTVFSNFGLTETAKDSSALASLELKIFFDPTIKANYRQALSGSIEKIIANLQNQWILDELHAQLSDGKNDVKKA